MNSNPAFSTAAEREAASIVYTDLAVRLHKATQASDAERAERLRALIAGLSAEYPEAIQAEKRLFKARC